MIRHQDIPTYPTFNLAQSEALMTKMGINAGAAVEIWSPHIKAWGLEDVNHSMNLKGQRELLVRFMGVTHCPGFKQLIGEVGDESPIVTIGHSKRRFEMDAEEMSLLAEERRRVASNSLSHCHSPLLSSRSSSITPFSSPFPLCSPFPLSPTSTELDLPLIFSTDELTMQDVRMDSPPDSLTIPPAPTHSVPNYDSLWTQGFVHIPDVQSWPSGMFARDMAWGLTKLKESRKDPEGRFRSVFPGVTYVKTTFYRQMDAFFGSTVTEMERCRLLTRGASGLWTDWRGSSSGWRKVAERGKKGSQNR